MHIMSDSPGHTCDHVSLSKVSLFNHVQGYGRCQSQSKQSREQHQQQSSTLHFHQQPKSCICGAAAWTGEPSGRIRLHLQLLQAALYCKLNNKFFFIILLFSISRL